MSTRTVIGSYLSPYVRKLLAVMNLKGLDYRIDPIAGFFGSDAFSELSPLRRIPVLIDDQLTLCDSTVICEYLDERYPQPALLPSSAADRARARWLEEYADTRMGEVFIWQLFYQRAIGPRIFGQTTDEAALQRALEVEIPQVLDYLERQLPAEGFLFGASLMLADIAIAVHFRNAAFLRWQVDAALWPRCAAYVDRVLAQDCLARLRPYEEHMLRVPVTEQRAALAAFGAPLSEETWGGQTPRRGLMKI
ncbi:MAG: glutathione S-transferase family protein [Stagnimonas sp.]|nr:glutathione S-transferase family protein [Stagnimonas sp.]